MIPITKEEFLKLTKALPMTYFSHRTTNGKRYITVDGKSIKLLNELRKTK